MSSDEGVNLEEEYFHREEQAKLAKLREEAAHKAAAEEKEKLRELHHLRCGKCGNKMDTQLYKGVEIEICPACGAVLLDPGELEKLAGADQSGIVSSIADLFSFSRKKK